MQANSSSIQSVQDRWSQMDPSVLISKKLKNENAPLSLEERILLLVGCIKVGEEQVVKVRKPQAQDPIIFLGNTGSGKSTLINYLAGCEMDYTDYIDASDVKANSLSNVVIVKSTSKQKEIMKIGHTHLSETFRHEIAVVDGRAYCDCPGFLDNRGDEVNVANIVNTRRVIQASKSIRLVLLVNYHSLCDGRVDGLKKTIQIAAQLFGNEQVFDAYRPSLLVGVTQVPERAQGDSAKSLDVLKNCMQLDQASPFEQKIAHVFAERLFIYHPLDEIDELSFTGGSTRSELLKKIDGLKKVTESKNTLHIVLTPEDEKRLREICEGMGKKIQQCLENREFAEANLMLALTSKIKLIEHPIALKLIDVCKAVVIQHFKLLVQEIDKELANQSTSLSLHAQDLFKTIALGIASFGEENISELEKAIGLPELKKRYSSHAKRIEFFEAESRLKALAVEFGDRCFAFDFERAEGLFKQIKQQFDENQARFKDLNLTSDLDLNLLEMQLHKSKGNQAVLNQKQEMLTEQRMQFNDYLQKMQEADEENRKQIMALIENQQQMMNQLSQQISQCMAERNNGDGEFFKDLFKFVFTKVVDKILV
jgi:energy-coupling factor transporter ATP-binding protein EcfA2